jgi:fatty acid desaturase
MNVNKLISPDELTALKLWKPSRYITYGLFNLTAFFGSAWVSLHIDNIFVYFLCWIFQGALLIAFSNAAHECTHNLMTPWKKVNRILGRFWMLPLFLNFTVHKYYHLKHHTFTTRESDPEFNFEYDGFKDLKSYLRSMLKWLTIIDPLHRLNWKEPYAAVRGRKTEFLTTNDRIQQARMDFLYVFCWLIASVALSVAWTKIMIVAYWIPVGFFMPIIAYITALPEHYDVKYGNDPLTNTRTVETSPLISFIFWHFNFHTAHHYSTGIPFYSLSKLNRRLSRQIIYKEKSYLVFHAKTISKILRKNKHI